MICCLLFGFVSLFCASCLLLSIFFLLIPLVFAFVVVIYSICSFAQLALQHFCFFVVFLCLAVPFCLFLNVYLIYSHSQLELQTFSSFVLVALHPCFGVIFVNVHGVSLDFPAFCCDS